MLKTVLCMLALALALVHNPAHADGAVNDNWAQRWYGDGVEQQELIGYWHEFSRECGMASIRIRDNNCGAVDCDCALYLTLKAGCRINSWGHYPRACEMPR